MFNVKATCVALALGICASAFNTVSAETDAERDYMGYNWSPKDKNAKKTDFNHWKADGHYYLTGGLTNNYHTLTFPNEAGADGSDHGFHIGLGYSFNDYFGVEVSLNELGEYSEVDEGNSRISYSANSVDFAIVGKYPIAPNWNVYGKMGISNWEAQLDMQGLPVDPDRFFRHGDSGSTLFLGGGVSYGLSRYTDVFVEFDRRAYEPVFNNIEHEADVTTFMVGFKFTFGMSQSSWE